MAVVDYGCSTGAGDWSGDHTNPHAPQDDGDADRSAGDGHQWTSAEPHADAPDEQCAWAPSVEHIHGPSDPVQQGQCVTLTPGGLGQCGR
eukprot:5846363-Amphidinium_carterae.2